MMSDKYKQYLVDKSLPLMESLKILNETGKRIVFVTDGEVLFGTLTYGDVSRWILKGKSLEVQSSEVATLEPMDIRTNDLDRSQDIFEETEINALPVVDDSKKIVRVLFKEEEVRQYGDVCVPVVVMAGGKGTRLYPYTKILPKPLIPIGEIPISEHIVNRFHKNGCNKFYFIVNYKKNMIKAYFNEMERPYDVSFVDEESPLGTGGGLGLLKGCISSTFVLTNCDSMIDDDFSVICDFHKHNHNSITMICSNQKYEVPYGVIETDHDGNLLEMSEKPSFSYLVNTGTYIVEPEIIDMIEPGVSIGFPDVIQKAKDFGYKIGVYKVNEKDWLDMGQFDAMAEMKKRLHIKE